jgi:di/tricarboxylate transporter
MKNAIRTAVISALQMINVFARKAARCAYVVILMAVFWLTEALPIGVTSLLPVLFFPTMGIMPSGNVTIGYFKVTSV